MANKYFEMPIRAEHRTRPRQASCLSLCEPPRTRRFPSFHFRVRPNCGPTVSEPRSTRLRCGIDAECERFSRILVELIVPGLHCEDQIAGIKLAVAIPIATRKIRVPIERIFVSARLHDGHEVR